MQDSIFHDSLITANRVGGFEIGDCIKTTLEKYKFIEDNGEYYLLLNDNDLIISIWSKDEKKIAGLTIYSSAFRTTEGLKVGISIDSLLKIFPNIKMGFSDLTGEEYFCIPKYTKNRDRYFLAYVKSDTGEELGEFISNDETNNFKTNGKIVKIEIYNWK